MTKEQRELLLKDLCTRLPYGVKISIPDLFTHKEEIETLDEIFKGDDGIYRVNSSGVCLEYVKPYLFPMSSMTDEQYNDFFAYFHNIEINEIKKSGDYLKAAYLGENAKREWLNKNHFDYNYHIEKGLVLDATGLNIY